MNVGDDEEEKHLCSFGDRLYVKRYLASLDYRVPSSSDSIIERSSMLLARRDSR